MSKKSLPSKNYFSLSSILSFVLCSYRYQPFENHEWLIIEQAAAIYLSRDLTFCVFYHQYIQDPGIQIFLQNKTQNNSERFSSIFANLLLWPFLLSGLGSQVAFLDMGSGPSRQKKKQSKIINVSWVERQQRKRGELWWKVSQARTEGHTDNKILQWDPWEGHLQVGGE